MCTEEAKLQALVDEWNHLDGLVNDIESRYLSVPLVVATLLAAGNYFGGEGYPADVVSLVVLAVSVSVFAYLAYEFRRVAYLRGALMLVERRINALMGGKAFKWNNHIVPKYLGNSWMNYVVPLTLGIAFATVDGVALVKLGESLPTEAVILIVGVLALVAIPCVVSLFYNGAVTKAVVENRPVGSWRRGGFKWRIER